MEIINADKGSRIITQSYKVKFWIWKAVQLKGFVYIETRSKFDNIISVLTILR